MLTLLVVIGDPINSFRISFFSITQLYVGPFESLVTNQSDGSLTRPYSSVQQALDHIESDYYRGITTAHRITIYLYPSYHFANSIRFRQIHSHIRLTIMTATYANYYENLLMKERNHRRLPIAKISGGVLLTNWTLVANNTYSTVVPLSMFVSQSFISNQRIVRTYISTV